MKIASFNINGVRAAEKKGLFKWVEDEQIDFLGVQEVKANRDQIDLKFMEDLGYEIYWHSAEKKGYSGVAVFSKRKADTVVLGMGNDKYDFEGRVIRTDYDDLSLLNCYFPSGSSGEERHVFKLDFLADFKKYVEELLETRKKLIVMGDYNIVHTEKDIHNPTRKDNPSGYRPEERKWMDEWFNLGFRDAYRKMHPEEINFSWWSYRANSRNKDKGWRIDYCSVSDPIQDKIISCVQQKEAFFSDHCPVVMEIDL
jgi:exodeoxyribonuclease-3